MSWMLGVIMELQVGKQKGNLGASLGDGRHETKKIPGDQILRKCM